MSARLLDSPDAKWQHGYGSNALGSETILSTRRQSPKPIEHGVEFFVEASGMGYREPNGLIWFTAVGGRRTVLLPGQMLTILSAAAEPLPGWPTRLTESWFNNPRRKVEPGQKRPVEVMLAFRDVAAAIDAVYESLSGAANDATIKALRLQAEEVARGQSNIDRYIVQAKRAFSRDSSLRNVLDEYRNAVADGADKALLALYGKRFAFLAEMAKGNKTKGALIKLMPALDAWYLRLFDKHPTRTWSQGQNDRGEEVSLPDGAFAAAASALLEEVGLQYTPATIHSNFGRWLTLEKSGSLHE